MSNRTLTADSHIYNAGRTMYDAAMDLFHIADATQDPCIQDEASSLLLRSRELVSEHLERVRQFEKDSGVTQRGIEFGKADLG